MSIEQPCPACGGVNVWMCSMRECPMKDFQKKERDTWQERRDNPPDENKSS